MVSSFDQSQFGEWSEGLPQPQIRLGEETGPVCDAETAQSEEAIRRFLKLRPKRKKKCML